jgi:penicillin-binding protein 1C
MQLKVGGYFFYFKRRTLFYYGLALFAVYFLHCLPAQLFKEPRSTVIISKEGDLLNARIAADGQWRFPALDSVPYKFEQSIIAFEDEEFHSHWGVDFTSIARAMYQNITAGEIVSGGSTLTMQVARMSRNSSRTLLNKLIEVIWSYRLEIRHSKVEILELYVSNAPFGGNVVGLEAASWRYFQLPPHQLSWSQTATLAVLPNAPGLIHPGKNRILLKKKRDFVLKKLFENEIIDSMTYQLSTEEPLVAAPNPLPMLANHLLQKALADGRTGERIQTTLNVHLQEKMTQLLHRHQQRLDQNYIHNAALLIIDTKENKVRSYVGNSAVKEEHDPYVNVIHARRSTGSLLKPFLYSAMMQEGMIHNDMLVPDVPLRFDNFAPKNFDKTHDGAVPVQDALSRSLNVPAVHLLEQYGVEKFLYLLNQLDQRYIDQPAEHYGLSLILGGAESSLWDVCHAYSGMVKTLALYNATNKYSTSTWDQADWKLSSSVDTTLTRSSTKLDAGAIYEVFEAMQNVNRPAAEASWQNFSSSRKVAWKTGTSFGNRDAWAIGCTPRYVVGVWVGNASGEGRPGLIGSSTAGPILFDVFSALAYEGKWFTPPYDEMATMKICKESGHRATEDCAQVSEVQVHKNGLRSPSCTFHQTILTDLNEQYRYNVQCSNGQQTKLVTRFVLPALQGWYYQTTHPSYRGLPPFHPMCQSQSDQQDFAIVYPKNGSNIVGIRDLDGDKNEIVLEAAHQTSSSTLFWHIDDVYLGATSSIHKMNYTPIPGEHRLTVIDEEGNEESVRFTVLSSD